MLNENRILRNIEGLGEKYRTSLMVDTKELESNWWSALRFFFDRSFMRGRRDALSDVYCRFTIEALKDYFSVEDSMNSENLEKAYRRLKQKDKLFDKQIILDFKKENPGMKGSAVKSPSFNSKVAVKNELIKALVTHRKISETYGSQSKHRSVRLGNEEDIMMVLDVLRLISNENKSNIYRYLKEAIANEGAKKAYSELQKIRAIAEKLASFVIRDIGLLNPEIIRPSDYEYAFPVDIWVVKVSKELRCDNEDPQVIKNFFIEKCNNFGISPLKVAAGLWFLGAKSLDIALEYLNEKESLI